MPQIIDDEKIILVRIILDIAIRTVISAVGVATNIINMIIFCSLGIKDSMAVGLFSLSFTDFLVTLFQLASSTCYVIDLLYPTNPIDSWTIGQFVFGFLINATYLMSCWITVLISIERCFCVVSPFTVKQVFTRHRCVTSVLIIYTVFILAHVPVYVTHKIQWTEVAQGAGGSNSTQTLMYVFTVHFTADTAYMELMFDLIVGVGVLFLAQAIIIVCAVLMGWSLKASSKIRQGNPGKTPARVADSHSSKYLESGTALSTREKRLIKVVLYLGVILTISNIPRIMTATAYHTIDGMATGSQQNLSTTLWAATSTMGSLGCSVTFFVYLILNSQYRRRLGQICRVVDSQ